MRWRERLAKVPAPREDADAGEVNRGELFQPILRCPTSRISRIHAESAPEKAGDIRVAAGAFVRFIGSPMTERSQPRLTPAKLSDVSQKLRLICKACGQRDTYDVGTINLWASTDEAAAGPGGYAFSTYFHCRDCGSAGPWEVDDYLKLTRLMLWAKMSGGNKSVMFATPALFDGTIVQTPALGEQHLLRRIEAEPGSAFLCTRLGNLLRGCGQRSPAAVWYGKALALDAGGLEARYHLLWFAVDDGDQAAAVEHARSLVRLLLAGTRAGSDELTRGIAVSVVEILRDAPPEIREEILGGPLGAAAAPADVVFMREVIAAQGEEQEIVNRAASRLLGGEPMPAIEPPPLTIAELDDDDGASIDLIPSLRQVVEAAGLDPRKLTVIPANGTERHIRVDDRHAVQLTDGKHLAVWRVESLRALFRGDKAPPPNVERYPPEYERCFFTIEKHVMMACDLEGDRTDQEMEPIYSALRRRPDGKNHLGPLHDFLWQAAAIMLGTHRLSQAEFEALVGQLERSVRKWALRPVSRNYARYLRDGWV